MKSSEHINEIATALSKAQGAMKSAQKDRDNPFFKSSYSTLAAVIDAIREPFQANGLSFAQPAYTDPNGAVVVETVIMHSSGQFISGELSARPVKSDPQGVGSVVTYLCRYGLKAMVGITSADDDDDGNAATKPGENAHHKTLSGYTGKPEQKAALLATLSQMQVPEDFNQKIIAKMYGRPSSDIKTVVREVTEDARLS